MIILKTLIVYATKYGCTEKCAGALAEKVFGDVALYNVKEDEWIPALGTFDNIIIGGSIYEGRIQKEIRKFCADNLDALLEKHIGLFVCGMQSGDKADQELFVSFPKELVEQADVMEFVGGEIHLDRMNFLDKFILKMVSKQPDTAFPFEDMSTISDNKLEKIANTFDMVGV